MFFLNVYIGLADDIIWFPAKLYGYPINRTSSAYISNESYFNECCITFMSQFHSFTHIKFSTFINI